MVRTFQLLIELLWPQVQTSNTAVPVVTVRHYKNVRYLHPYKTPAVQSAIKQTKYHADRLAAAQLAQWLDNYLQSLPPNFAIIPMPISYQRWRTRGYNQIELLCQYSAYRRHVRFDILKKRHHTTQQTKVTKTQRLAQQANTFDCHPVRCHTLPPLVILLDDVVTTGATIEAASAALQPHLPAHTTLMCLAIAH